jgi:hypothetical protein
MPLSSQLRKAITNWRKNSKSQKTLPFFSGIFFLWNQNQKQKAVRKNVYYAHRIPTKIIYYRLRYLLPFADAFIYHHFALRIPSKIFAGLRRPLRSAIQLYFSIS